jgi:hypothetical protein
LRNIADEAPEIAERVLHVAEELEMETADIERRGADAEAI